MLLSRCLRVLVTALFAFPGPLAGIQGPRAEAADVLIAVVSSGADSTSKSAGPRLQLGRTFVAGGDASADDLGCGTRLAELIADACPGVAVHILPLQVANSRTPDPSPAALASAVDAAVAAKADILLVACVSTRRHAPVAEALDRALKKGIVVLAPAGSSPEGFDLFPASHPGVLSVAGIEPAPASSPQALPWRLTAFANASARTDVLAPALDRERDLWGSGVAAARAAAFAAVALARRSDVPREKRREWLLGLGDGAIAGNDAPGRFTRVWDPAAIKTALARAPEGGRLELVSMVAASRHSLRIRVLNTSSAAAKGTLRVYSTLLREPVMAGIPEVAPGATAVVVVETGADAGMTRCVEIAGPREDSPPADTVLLSAPVQAWANSFCIAGLEVEPPEAGATTVVVRIHVANLTGSDAEKVPILVGLGGAEKTRMVATAENALTPVEFVMDIPAPGKARSALPLLVEVGPGAQAAARGGTVPADADPIHLEPPPVRK